MLRKILIRLFPLLAFSITVALCLGVLEVYVRVFYPQRASLYTGLDCMPESYDKYFQLVFLEQYATPNSWNTANYDPQLGWDYYITTNRIRGGGKIGPKSPQTPRILFLGDSFTYGIEVNDDECFPYFLEKIMREEGGGKAEVLNMGVGSYGIDQMLLKYLEHGRKSNPDLVVVGIFPHDYDRTRLSFYSFAKPLFRYDDGKRDYVLSNTPVPPPQEVHAQLERQFGGPTSYILTLMKNRLFKIYHYIANPSDPNGYHAQTDQLVQHLLGRLQKEVANQKGRLCVVHIPAGNYFENSALLDRGRQDVVTDRLKRIYGALQIPYIDLLEEFSRRFPLETIYRDFYLHRPDGSIGHFSIRGNQEVAKILLQGLTERNLLKVKN